MDPGHRCLEGQGALGGSPCWSQQVPCYPMLFSDQQLPRLERQTGVICKFFQLHRQGDYCVAKVSSVWKASISRSMDLKHRVVLDPCRSLQSPHIIHVTPASLFRVHGSCIGSTCCISTIDSSVAVFGHLSTLLIRCSASYGLM